MENGRFVVTMVLLFSLRSEITLNSNSDWCRLKLRYIRVSSKEQNVDRQSDALYSMGLHAKQIYIDKQSGMMHELKAFCFEVRETVCETRYIVSKELILEKSDGFLLKIMSTCVII